MGSRYSGNQYKSRLSFLMNYFIMLIIESSPYSIDSWTYGHLVLNLRMPMFSLYKSF